MSGKGLYARIKGLCNHTERVGNTMMLHHLRHMYKMMENNGFVRYNKKKVLRKELTMSVIGKKKRLIKYLMLCPEFMIRRNLK